MASASTVARGRPSSSNSPRSPAVAWRVPKSASPGPPDMRGPTRTVAHGTGAPSLPTTRPATRAPAASSMRTPATGWMPSTARGSELPGACSGWVA